MTCNGSPNTLDTVSTAVCSIAAGSQITLRWGHTLTSGSDDVIDASHKGPVMVRTLQEWAGCRLTCHRYIWPKLAMPGLALHLVSKLANKYGNLLIR